MSGAHPSVTARTPAVVPPPGHCPVRRWYEDELGWPTAPGAPVSLVLGVRFDVLEVPAEAGPAALRRLGPRTPVAARGDRLQLLVAAGSAEELPGLLEWLDWGALPLGLRALGSGAVMEAPPRPASASASPAVEETGARSPAGASPARSPDTGPPQPVRAPAPSSPAPTGVPSPRLPGPGTGRPLPLGRPGSQGAAVWLRPPEPGCEVEASLPTLSALGGGGDAPDLVRLVDTVATQCLRARLGRACARPPALRAQGR